MNGVKSSVRYLSEGELITGGRGRSVKGGGGVKFRREGELSCMRREGKLS